MTETTEFPPAMHAALDYAALGWSVIPLCACDHVGVGRKHLMACSSPGKMPFIPNTQSSYWGEFQTRRADKAEIAGWFRHSPNINIGVALGEVSRMIAIDIDSAVGEDLLAKLAGDDLPDTLEYTTGKGRRLMYSLPDGVQFASTYTNDENRKEAIRYMGLGSQVVMPPSVHHTGKMYEWKKLCGPDDLPAAPAPAWLLEIGVKKAKQDANRQVPVDGELISEGGRNNYLIRLAGAMRRQGADYEIILAALDATNETKFETKLNEFEVRQVARSVTRYAPNPDSVPIVWGGEDPDSLPPEATNPKCAADVAGIDDLKRAGAKTEWLWPGWIQKGVLTAFAAEGGTGKTREAADLVRRIRHREPWPDGAPMIEWMGETVALWVVADNHHSEMVSLCDAFGISDCVKINSHPADVYGGVSLEMAEDINALEKRIAACRPMLVFIDTVGNSTDKNLSKQEDAKAYYQPLQVVSRRQNVAILCLTHLNGTGKVLGRRVMEKVRQVWRMSAETINDHTCRRRLEVIKSNNPYPPALGVTMTSEGNQYDTNPPASPEDRDKAEKGPSMAVRECADWLKNLLSDGPKRVAILISSAQGKGWGKSTLYEAQRLVKARQIGKPRALLWTLEPESATDGATGYQETGYDDD